MLNLKIRIITYSSNPFQENGTEAITQKTGKVQIADDAKKEDGHHPKKPTMRKKSMKKKKMTDEEIMASLSKCSRISGKAWWGVGGGGGRSPTIVITLSGSPRIVITLSG